MSAREDPRSPHWWGWRYYGAHPTTRLLAKYGLTLAPGRPPSDALRESVAERAEREARRRDRARKVAEDVEALRSTFDAEQRARDVEARWQSMTPDRREAMREDVRRFGRDPVIAMWRRLTGDATFDLPSTLEEE